jgi:hypothetical protein
LRTQISLPATTTRLISSSGRWSAWKRRRLSLVLSNGFPVKCCLGKDQSCALLPAMLGSV